MFIVYAMDISVKGVSFPPLSVVVVSLVVWLVSSSSVRFRFLYCYLSPLPAATGTESSPTSDHTKLTRLKIIKRKLLTGDTCVGGGTSTSNEVQQLAERRTKKKSDVLVSEQVENENSGTHNVGLPVVEDTSIIRLWTTPYPLFTAMIKLSDEQKKCIEPFVCRSREVRHGAWMVQEPRYKECLQKMIFRRNLKEHSMKPQLGDEPNDGDEQVILGSDGKVDEIREFETPTQFFQHPDVIPAVDVAIWEEMSRKKETTSSALPLDSIPNFSLGMMQEFEENCATDGNMTVHVPEMQVSGNNKGKNIIMYDKGKGPAGSGNHICTNVVDRSSNMQTSLKTRVRASL
ncbi:hypothetical protein L6452_08296 [Arctium lappa]|uniref:Uncharacterized protein n=1 Tax=Arctium lappa TaxID=4217 RepID=A0ACB9DHI3_ARCLA|nr:hypothetical protein L6452_08296 [Arctium lappa]